jgi:hypothetical protein
MVLSQGNAINARMLGQNLRVSSSPEKLQPAVRLTQSAAVLESVQQGWLGGRRLRKVVNWILGNSNGSRLPLAGNLIIGSIEQGGDNLVIPMVAPLTAEEILKNIGSGVKLIGRTTQKINESNPLVNVEEEMINQMAISATAGRIADLPNGRRIEKVAEAAMGNYAQLTNDLVSDDELKRAKERVVKEGGQGIDTNYEKARQAAAAILKDESAVRGYKQNRRKWENNIRNSQPPEVAAVYIQALNDRAEEILATGLWQPEANGIRTKIDELKATKIRQQVEQNVANTTASNSDKAKPVEVVEINSLEQLPPDSPLRRLPRKSK